MRRALLLTAAVAAFAAGCGDDDKEEQAAATEATGVTLVDAPGPPADAAKLAERCGLGAPQDGATFKVPEGLLPEGAFVLRSEGDSATLVFRSSLRDAYTAMLANAKKHGLEIEESELEGVDAELELRVDDGELKLAFGLAGTCADVSRATAGNERE